MTLSPQISGTAPPPVMTSDQILQHVDSVYQGLPDPVRQALDHAHSLTGGGGYTGGTLGDVVKPSESPSSQNGPVDVPSPPIPTHGGPSDEGMPSEAESPLPALAMDSASVNTDQGSALAPPPVTTEIADLDRAQPKGSGLAPPPVSAVAAEHARLTAPPRAAGDPLAHTRQDTGVSGVQQVKNPFLRGLAIAGDVVGSGLFPRIGQFIPGTSAHRASVVGENEHALASEQASAKNAADVAETQAKTKEQESLPELHKTQAELAAEKLHTSNELNQSKQDLAREKEDRQKSENQSKIDAALAHNGFKHGPDGVSIVPLEYGEMSEQQQAVHDLQASRKELADASAEYKKAQTANAPALMELQKRRIDNANHTAQIAERRLGLSEQQFGLKVGGAPESEAHPGQLVDDNGKTVGTAFQGNVRPTGLERTKADMAKSAQEQIADMRSIIQKRPDVFGPFAGRKTDLEVWLGSQDPDAQRFRAAETVAADHMAGMFGARSPAVVKDLKDAIGHFKDNPAAALAGIDQVEKATHVFTKAGTVNTAKPNAPATPKVYTQANVDAAVAAGHGNAKDIEDAFKAKGYVKK